MMPHTFPKFLLLALTAWSLLGAVLPMALAQRWPPPRQTSPPVYVHQASGADSRTCAQAQQPATPRQTIQAGIACLQPGGTLVIGPGTYPELLFGQFSSDPAYVPSAILSLQPGTRPIPNGLEEQPTTITGHGTVVLSPALFNSEGGGILTLYDVGRWLHFEGLTFRKAQSPANAMAGVHLGNSYDVTFTGNEVAYGWVKSGDTSRRHTITANDVHHSGAGCDTNVQRNPPCPHGMYVCGQGHVISDNRVEYNANYGIHVSCEQQGIADVLVTRNLVRHNNGVGIRVAGARVQATANLLESNGSGITVGGPDAVIANNTIVGYWEHAPDPVGIMYWPGSVAAVANNLLYGQKSAAAMVRDQNGQACPASLCHHNMSELSGNQAVSMIAPASAVFTASASGDYTLAASSPARGAGVPVPGLTTDLAGAAYATPPSLGAAEHTMPPPEPEPPQPGALTLACTGIVSAVPGAVQLTCVQQTGGGR